MSSSRTANWSHRPRVSDRIDPPDANLVHHQPCRRHKSQISHAVADAWEHYAATAPKSPEVAAFAKNDHLGYQIYYLWHGSNRIPPDFLIRQANGKHRDGDQGSDSDQNRNKRMALDVWVRAVNARGGFGTWC